MGFVGQYDAPPRVEELLRLAGAPATRAELVATLGGMDENPTTTMNRVRTRSKTTSLLE